MLKYKIVSTSVVFSLLISVYKNCFFTKATVFTFEYVLQLGKNKWKNK